MTVAMKAVRQLRAFDASPARCSRYCARLYGVIEELPLFPDTIDNWKESVLKERVTCAAFDPENTAFRYSSGNLCKYADELHGKWQYTTAILFL